MKHLYFFDQKVKYLSNIRKLLILLIFYYLQQPNEVDKRQAVIFEKLLTQARLNDFSLTKLIALESDLLKEYKEIIHVK